MLVSDYYQQLDICHFCHDCCVPPMNLSPTCVLQYAIASLQGCMPCIFVISVVTSTSMQTRLRDVSIFRDFEFCQVCDCCYFVAMYPSGYREIRASFGHVQ